MRKYIWILLLIFTGLYLGVAFSMDTSISNSYQRALAAAFISETFLQDPFNLPGVMSIFEKGQYQYNIFSGFSDWPPLQMLLLALSFFLFGVNKFSFILPSLLISLAALYYVYKLSISIFEEEPVFKQKNLAAIISIALAGFGTLFFYEATAPFLENGVLLFSAASFYYFYLFLKQSKNKYLYLTALFFGLGLLYKEQMILSAIPLFAIFFLRGKPKTFFSKSTNYKALLLSIALVILIISPLIARELFLAQYGVSRFASRNAERLTFIYEPDINQKGFLTANDLEFSNSVSESKMQLILNRYHISYLQKFVVFATSTFYNWILLPFIILGLYRRKPFRLSSYSTGELTILLFFITNLAFFSFHGLIPRYTIPTIALLSIFATKGLFKMKKFLVPALLILLAIMAFQNAMFFSKIYNGEHIQSMQHDYRGTASHILNETTEEVTVITTRVYQMSYQFLLQDTNRKAYIEFASQESDKLREMIKGNFGRPEYLPSESQISYNSTRPPVKYVVVHQGLETGPLKGVSDYDLNEFMKEYNTTKTTISSKYPNAETYIYKIIN